MHHPSLPKFLRTPLELKTWIPISIEPSFLLLLAFLGYSFGDGAAQGCVAAIVAAVSVLWHELGHALAARTFGLRPKISLVGYGGNTAPGKNALSFWREILFILSGPLAGFLLAGLAFAALRLGGAPRELPLLRFAVIIALSVNLAWSILNLLPALPLDGGNLLRIVLNRLFGPRGLRYLYWWSTFGCAALAVWGLWRKDWLLAGFAYVMAASNFQTVRLFSVMSDAEMEPASQRVLEKVVVLEQEKQWQQAYDLLLPLEPILGPRNTCALALQACATGRHRKAIDLCESLHKKRKKDYSVAFIVARGYAGLEDATMAAAWLKKAVADGLPKADECVKACGEFDRIRETPIIRLALLPRQTRG